MEENKVLANLKERRSVRSFKQEPVKEEDLNLILEAGTYAPTGMGKQSPTMVVLTKKEDIDELEALNRCHTAQEHPFYGAPCVIVVLADKERVTCVEDGSLVMGNLMNAAHSVGVGSCWIHRAKQVFDSPEGKALLKKWGLSENLIGVGHCILGYPEGPLPAAKPRKADYIVRV